MSGSSLKRHLALTIVRPYIRRELPGWGHLYQHFAGRYGPNDGWQGAGQRWSRGKIHGYDQLLDLTRWSPRAAYFLGRFYDLPTQLLVCASLRPGDTFVDVGANEGHISLVAAHRVGAAGRVIAFEPNPGPREIFKAALERNNIGIVDLRARGLSDKAAELTLTVPLVNSGEGSFGRSAYGRDDVTTLTCPVAVGDAELAGETPRLVKIDVEGFETQVVRGLGDTLARTRPAVVMEVVHNHLVNAGSGVVELATLMKGHGYRPLQLGLRRAGLRHRLRLTPMMPEAGFSGDVLWLPVEGGDLTAAVTPFIG